MLPVLPKPPITPGQKKAALAVAGVVDVIQVGLLPLVAPGGLSPLEWGLDVACALILMAVCGFKWQFILAFFIELLPIVDIFPTWSAVVLMLPSEEPRVNVQPVSPPPVAAKNNFVEVDAVVIPPVQPGKLEKANSPLAP